MNLGKYGEELARKYLEAKGYELLRRNYRYERAEIDLVFKDEAGRVLIFVEVKTRRTRTFGDPEDSVIIQKKEQLIKSAQGFLMENTEYDDYEKRFDVVAVLIDGNKEEIDYIVNAF